MEKNLPAPIEGRCAASAAVLLLGV